MKDVEWIDKLEEYLCSTECEEYSNHVHQNQTFHYLVSVLFGTMDGDWNYIDFDKITEEDILKLEEFLDYGQDVICNLRIDEEYLKYLQFEKEYDSCHAMKMYFEACKSVPYKVGRKIECI